jgi:hypothetical protein
MDDARIAGFYFSPFFRRHVPAVIIKPSHLGQTNADKVSQNLLRPARLHVLISPRTLLPRR